MADCPIDDYHDQDASEDAGVVDDEVEAGPEDYGETGDVEDPAELADYSHEDKGTGVFEFFEDVACCLEREAEGCDYDGPEVDSAVAFEGYVDEDE